VTGEESLRIEHTEPQKERAFEILLPPGESPFLEPLQQLRRIWKHICLKRIRCVELAQETDHLILGGGVVRESFTNQIPYFLYGSLSVHESDDPMGGRGEPLKMAGRMVLKDIPDFATIMMAVNFQMVSQPRL